jgi:hypothetical protein
MQLRRMHFVLLGAALPTFDVDGGVGGGGGFNIYIYIITRGSNTGVSSKKSNQQRAVALYKTVVLLSENGQDSARFVRTVFVFFVCVVRRKPGNETIHKFGPGYQGIFRL